jgi:hypothetical protein
MQNQILEYIRIEGIDVFTNPDKLASLSDLIQSYFKQMNIAHKYIEMKLKLCGDLPKDNKMFKVNDAQHHTVNRPFHDMTDDEIKDELARLAAR